MRLIDADALIAWTDNYCVDEKFTVAHFANMVRDMPTVQPEIIRCMYCKYMIDAELLQQVILDVCLQKGEPMDGRSRIGEVRHEQT